MFDHFSKLFHWSALPQGHMKSNGDQAQWKVLRSSKGLEMEKGKRRTRMMFAQRTRQQKVELNSILRSSNCQKFWDCFTQFLKSQCTVGFIPADQKDNEPIFIRGGEGLEWAWTLSAINYQCTVKSQKNSRSYHAQNKWSSILISQNKYYSNYLTSLSSRVTCLGGNRKANKGVGQKTCP